MPQTQRQRVWKGDLKKTSGGLEKKHLVKNKRGKIVSKKKSEQAAAENNLGKWLRKSGDSFAKVPQGVHQVKKEEPSHPAAKSAAAKKVKSPKPMVHKPKPKPAKSKPEPPVKRKRAEPMVAGEKKDLSKISVGNIDVPGSGWKKHPDWPKWTRGLPNSTVKKIEKELKRDVLDWSDLEDDYGPIGGSWTTSKRKRTAKEVKRRLRATKRRGKRRTKRQLLQDVLD